MLLDDQVTRLPSEWDCDQSLFSDAKIETCGKEDMVQRFTVEEAGYVMYTDMLDRLRARFPAVPAWRLDQIVTAEHEAITGGVLRIVPADVEAGAIEMLSREHTRTPSDDGEVA